jgi:hypothetical protein
MLAAPPVSQRIMGSFQTSGSCPEPSPGLARTNTQTRPGLLCRFNFQISGKGGEFTGDGLSIAAPG